MMPSTVAKLELAEKYAGFSPHAPNVDDERRELFALLNEGIAAMANGGGHPVSEVFAKLKDDFGYEDV